MRNRIPSSRLVAVLAAIGLCVSSCASIEAEPEEAAITLCEEPRPQICTRDYRPVCTVSATGPGRTAGNPCTACSDPEVSGYVVGECPPA